MQTGKPLPLRHVVAETWTDAKWINKMASVKIDDDSGWSDQDEHVNLVPEYDEIDRILELHSLADPPSSRRMDSLGGFPALRYRSCLASLRSKLLVSEVCIEPQIWRSELALMFCFPIAMPLGCDTCPTQARYLQQSPLAHSPGARIHRYFEIDNRASRAPIGLYQIPPYHPRARSTCLRRCCSQGVKRSRRSR